MIISLPLLIAGFRSRANGVPGGQLPIGEMGVRSFISDRQADRSDADPEIHVGHRQMSRLSEQPCKRALDYTLLVVGKVLKAVLAVQNVKDDSVLGGGPWRHLRFE
ncbi:hypothetical protein D3C72_2103970 [compost metagenome]